jgi:hypothetical protein
MSAITHYRLKPAILNPPLTHYAPEGIANGNGSPNTASGWGISSTFKICC